MDRTWTMICFFTRDYDCRLYQISCCLYGLHHVFHTYIVDKQWGITLYLRDIVTPEDTRSGSCNDVLEPGQQMKAISRAMLNGMQGCNWQRHLQMLEMTEGRKAWKGMKKEQAQ